MNILTGLFISAISGDILDFYARVLATMPSYCPELELVGLTSCQKLLRE